MNLKLIASAPSKRFDVNDLCEDGRGGWTFSQVNADRWITDYQDYWLIFYYAVLVENAQENDFVESVLMQASMDGEPIGDQTIDWNRPNPMWGYSNGNAIFEFSHPIMMEPKKDGLIKFDLKVKLNSHKEWLSVEGSGYCRIKLVNPEDVNRKHLSPTNFSIRSLFVKSSFWKRPN